MAVRTATDGTFRLEKTSDFSNDTQHVHTGAVDWTRISIVLINFAAWRIDEVP